MSGEWLLGLGLIAAVTVSAAVRAALARRRARRARRMLAAELTVPAGAGSPSAAAVDWADGSPLGAGFVVLSKLGRGGFGHVFLVESQLQRARWAVKIVRRDKISAERRAALLDELCGWLLIPVHPHVVRCSFFRTIGEDLAIFAEVVDGGALTNWLARPALATLVGVLGVALELAWALEAVHAAGLVHQDVKPDNVLMTAQGVVKLTDLGLAQAVNPGGSADARTGTWLYHSPEQGRGQQVTAATDVWSFAVTLLALLLGEQPAHAAGELAGLTLDELEATSLPGRPRPSPGLFDLLRRCLHESPSARPTMAEIARWLEAELARLGQQRVTAPAVAMPREAASRAGRVRAGALALDHVSAAIQAGRRDLGPAALELALDKAAQHAAAGDLPGAARSIEQTLELTGDAAPATRARLELGALRLEQGELARAEAAFADAERGGAGDGERARARHGRALVALARGERPQALTLMQDAVMLAAARVDSSPGPASRLEHAALLLDLAQLLAELGLPEAEPCLEHAGRVLQAAGHGRSLGRLRLLRARERRQAGRFTGALHEVDAALDLLAADAALGAAARIEKGAILVARGEVEVGARLARDGLARLEAEVASGHADLGAELARARAEVARLSG